MLSNRINKNKLVESHFEWKEEFCVFLDSKSVETDILHDIQI
jgi:hypothetical protein